MTTAKDKPGLMWKRFPLFASGSVIGVAIDYVVTLSASNVMGFYPAGALALAMVVSGSTVFFFHYRVTFRRSPGKLLRRYLLFMSWTGLIFLLRALLLQTCLLIGLPLAIALTIAIGLLAVINFVISSALIWAEKPS